ncbi:MAG: hypothetical protein ACR2FQ_01260 [Pseudonocardiaceae bacterium]
MPIRTSRGRAAVYRTLWGWPLRSPLHLLGAVVAVVALVALVAALPANRDPAVAAQPTGASQEANPFDPTSRHSAAARSAPRAPAAALAVADSWVRAFLTVPDGITAQQWTEQLRPYSTDEAVAALLTVDPANVPVAQVTGDPRTVTTRIGAARVDVPTSAAVVRVNLVTTSTGWRVARYEQAG